MLLISLCILCLYPHYGLASPPPDPSPSHLVRTRHHGRSLLRHQARLQARGSYTDALLTTPGGGAGPGVRCHLVVLHAASPYLANRLDGAMDEKVNDRLGNRTDYSNDDTMEYMDAELAEQSHNSHDDRHNARRDETKITSKKVSQELAGDQVTHETGGKEDGPKVIVLELDIDPGILSDLVGYFYSGEILLKIDNIEAIIRAVQLLQLEDIEKQAEKFTIRHLNTNTAIQWYRLAQKYHLTSLSNKVTKLMQTQLLDVSNTSGFENLTFAELAAVIQDEMLDPNDVLQTVVRWLMVDGTDRRENMEQLVPLIKLDQCTLEVLQRVSSTYGHLFYNYELQRMLNEALIHSITHLQTSSTRDMSNLATISSKVGGETANVSLQLEANCTNCTDDEIFNTTTDVVNATGDLLYEDTTCIKRNEEAAETVQNLTHYGNRSRHFGDNSQLVKIEQCYDSLSIERLQERQYMNKTTLYWENMNTLKHFQSSKYALCPVPNGLFAVNDFGPVKYNTLDTSEIAIPNVSTPTQPGVVYYNNKVYIFAGKKPYTYGTTELYMQTRYATDEMMVIDLTTYKTQELPRMPTNAVKPLSAILGSRIYVLRHRYEKGPVVFMAFDLKEEFWTMLAPLPVRGSNAQYAKMVTFEGSLYVFIAQPGVSYCARYDAVGDTWEEFTCPLKSVNNEKIYINNVFTFHGEIYLGVSNVTSVEERTYYQLRRYDKYDNTVYKLDITSMETTATDIPAPYYSEEKLGDYTFMDMNFPIDLFK